MNDTTDDDAAAVLREYAIALAPAMATDEARVLVVARRRRALRAGGHTVLAAGCAAALAAGVNQIVASDLGVTELPPASGVDRDGQGFGPFGLRCGDPVPVRRDAPRHAPDEVHLELLTTLPPGTSGGEVAVDLVLVVPFTDGDDIEPVIEQSPQLLVGRDGVIVGMTTIQEEPTALTTTRTEDTLRVGGLHQSIQLTDCAASQPLPAGDYDLYAAQNFTQATPQATRGTSTATGPWPFSIVQPQP